MARYRDKLIGLGGTFDHLHDGHRAFLSFASKLGKPLVVGITTKELLRAKKYPKAIQTWARRAKNVANFLNTQQCRFEIIKLSNPVGPTIENPDYYGIAVTEATTAGAQYINQLRAKLNLPQLEIFVTQLKTDSTGKVISSSRIRAGEIDQQGTNFWTAISTGVVISDQARKELTKVQGELVDFPSLSQAQLAVVGDFCLNQFIENEWYFDLGVYDLKSQRQPLTKGKTLTLTSDLQVANKAGIISRDLAKILLEFNWSKPKQLLMVTGEEDLAAVALVLTMPLYSHIYYGQANQGMVEMVVTPELKTKVYSLLSN